MTPPGSGGRSPWRFLLSGLFACLLGCSGDPSVARFENYRERLARSVKLAPVDAIPIEPRTRPPRRSLALEATEQSIGLLSFLKLYDCALWQTVGERNSALGKVATASQRLFTELDFLRLAPDCIASLKGRGEDALAAQLSTALEIKRHELPIRIWQATLGSEEFEQLWHIPLELGAYDADADLALETPLATLGSWVARWLDGDHRYDSEAFELALGAVRHGNAGYWLRAAALTESQLRAASDTVERRLAGRPLCFDGKANQQARIFLNVVQGYFVGDVQVWAASINRVLYRVVPAHARLEHALETVQPSVYQDWAEARDTQLNALSGASRDHVATLQPLLQRCGLLPARATG
ncbi:MAG: DUF3080 family protein [Pseudomonadota bacterium]